MILSTIPKAKLVLIGTCLFILGILTYIYRTPTNDDAWFAEQSYWLDKTGIVRSDFFKGLLGWDKQLLVSHKLFLLIGAGLIHVFGFQVPVVQFVGLISFYLLVGLLLFYVYKQENQLPSHYALAVLILLFANRLLIKMSFENRPELLVAAFGFGSFLAIFFSKGKTGPAIVGGALAGCALLSHLNGVIYVAAGIVTLLYMRQYKQAVVFAIVGGLVSVAYFIDVVQAENGFSVWYYQFRNDPATQNAFDLQSKLLVLLTYPKIFFQSPEQIALSLLLVFLGWHQRKVIKAVPLMLRVYFIAILLIFWLITKRSTGYYMLLFIPFMMVLIYELYRLKPFTNTALKLVIALYFIIGIFGMGKLIYTNIRLGSLPDSYRKLRAYIPQHEMGLVPITYFFNEYEQHPGALLCHENYGHYNKHTADPVREIADWAHNQNVGFLLFDYKYRPEQFNPKPNTKQIPHYNLRFFDGRFAVYTKAH